MNLPLNLWDCDRFSLDDAAGVGVVVAEPKNQSIHQVYAVLKREVHARSLSHFCYHFQSRCHYSTLLVSSVLTFAKLLVENVSVITIADAGVVGILHRFCILFRYIALQSKWCRKTVGWNRYAITRLICDFFFWRSQ